MTLEQVIEFIDANCEDEKLIRKINRYTYVYIEGFRARKKGVATLPIKGAAKSDLSLEEQFLALVNHYAKREFKVVPRGAKETLKVFTLEQIETALKVATVDSWHKDKLKELSSDYLMRRSTIDNLLNKNAKSAKQLESDRKLKEAHEAFTRNS